MDVLLSPVICLAGATLQSRSKGWRLQSCKWADKFICDQRDFSQAHGELDEVVSYKRGQLTAEVVERLSKRHKFITYPNMGHEGTLVSMS